MGSQPLPLFPNPDRGHRLGMYEEEEGRGGGSYKLVYLNFSPVLLMGSVGRDPLLPVPPHRLRWFTELLQPCLPVPPPLYGNIKTEPPSSNHNLILIYLYENEMKSIHVYKYINTHT